MEERNSVLGIDLGGTTAAIAAAGENGTTEIFPNEDGDRLTASVVWFPAGAGNPSIVVGKMALDAARDEPGHLAWFGKAAIGTDAGKMAVEGREWGPERIGAMIARKLARGVEMADVRTERAAMSCPVEFTETQRRATKLAGELAGLDVVGVVTEPVAVALHYGLNRSEGPRTAVVVDLGGSTFTASVVEASEDGLEVVCSGGTGHLGGRDWNRMLIRHIAEQFAEENGGTAGDLLADPDTAEDLAKDAEILKHALTLRPKAVCMLVHGGCRRRIEVSRETFDALTQPLLRTVEMKIREVVGMAREKGVGRIDRFLLAGGGSRMPQVMEMVKAKFAPLLECEPESNAPDEAVARGAALYGKWQSEPGGMPLPRGRGQAKSHSASKIVRTNLKGDLEVRVENASGQVLARFPGLITEGWYTTRVERGASLALPMEQAGDGLTVGVFAKDERPGGGMIVELKLSTEGLPQSGSLQLDIGIGLGLDGCLSLQIGNDAQGEFLSTRMPLEEERCSIEEIEDGGWHTMGIFVDP